MPDLPRSRGRRSGRAGRVALCFYLIVASCSSQAFSLRELLGLGESATSQTESTQPANASAAANNSAADAQPQGQAPAQPNTSATAARDQAPVSDAASPQARVSARGGFRPLELNAVALLVALQGFDRARVLLGDPGQFKSLIDSEVARRELLSLAVKSGLPAEQLVRLRMARAAEQALLDAYLEQLVGFEITSDFPSEAEARRFFDSNKKAFNAPGRVAIWQIFLPAPATASAAKWRELMQRANSIAAEIESGKQSFANAARAHSEHQASRALGGFMGIVEIDKLLPVVRKAAETLSLGEVSSPLRSKHGLHIVRIGDRIDSVDIEFDSVKQVVRQRLREQTETRIRRGAASRALDTSATRPSADEVEQWRATLIEKLRGMKPSESGAKSK